MLPASAYLLNEKNVDFFFNYNSIGKVFSFKLVCVFTYFSLNKLKM